jgi:pimeloyl-ACP methyl ester carboxylesterase
LTASGEKNQETLMFHSGIPGKPVVVLIHGLGMNSHIWTDPDKCFVLGGLTPLTIFLTDSPGDPAKKVTMGKVHPGIKGLWQRLAAEGFSVVSWSQSQPLGPIAVAIDELKKTVEWVRKKWPAEQIYLVGHSRGGLIARKYLLQEETQNISGLITICSPHAGTQMAKYGGYLTPTGAFLEKILPAESQTAVAAALKRLSLFLQSPAIEELSPKADFIHSIAEPLPEKLRLLSFGGTSPALFQVYYKFNQNKDFTALKFPDLLVRAVPAIFLPPELTPGSGDALVSSKSARLAGSTHYDLPVNHVKAAFDANIYTTLLNFLSPHWPMPPQKTITV